MIKYYGNNSSFCQIMKDILLLSLYFKPYSNWWLVFWDNDRCFHGIWNNMTIDWMSLIEDRNIVPLIQDGRMRCDGWISIQNMIGSTCFRFRLSIQSIGYHTWNIGTKHGTQILYGTDRMFGQWTNEWVNDQCSHIRWFECCIPKCVHKRTNRV